MFDSIDLLACPVCRGEFSVQSVDAEHGWLACNTCVSLTPVLFGMALFTETRYGGAQPPSLDGLAEQLFGSQAEYARYIDDKCQRGLVDAYAAFEPFNESTRCAPPIVRAARDGLHPGDAVLDLGIRTGWSGAMLAGMCAQQRVLSICWSGAGVLGYRGFRHWFSGAKRIPNLRIVFSPITDALPLRDGAFALVHSYDSLHRSPGPMLVNYALRAASADAPIIHAHVHLADAQPEPYFERGGILRSAADYCGFLDTRLHDDSRTAVVAVEAALFAAIGKHEIDWNALQTAPGYNGCIVLATPDVFETSRQLELIRPDPAPDDRMLANPLLRINPFTGAVHIDDDALGGRTREMLQRHPPFAAALRAQCPSQLDAQSIALLRVAESGATIVEVVQQLGEPLERTLHRVAGLSAQQLLIAAPFSPSYHALFRFHGNQRSVLDQNLGRVLAEWAAQSPDSPGGSLFGDEVQRRDALLILAALTDYFRSIDIGPGDPVAFAATGADSVWPLAACLLLGAYPAEVHARTARIAIVDHPLGRWERELCLADNPGAPVTLAKVLAAYVDDSQQPEFANGAHLVTSSTRHWMDWIGMDAKGRLVSTHALK